jgi:hypothetical protein
LHEYVSFALFSVGSILDRDTEARLNKEVSLAMQNLTPTG